MNHCSCCCFQEAPRSWDFGDDFPESFPLSRLPRFSNYKSVHIYRHVFFLFLHMLFLFSFFTWRRIKFFPLTAAPYCFLIVVYSRMMEWLCASFLCSAILLEYTLIKVSRTITSFILLTPKRWNSNQSPFLEIHESPDRCKIIVF